MEKETTVTWNELTIKVHYEENGYPDVILKDVYCEDAPITFLEKVQECKDIVGEVATLVGEHWSETINEEPDIFDKADYYYEMQNEK
jgi:hypothetical protein